MRTITDIDTSNYVWLAMTSHGWGWSAKSEADAIKACREHMGSNHVKRFGYATYRVHPDFEIDQVHGDIYTPKGHAPILMTNKVVKAKSQK